MKAIVLGLLLISMIQSHKLLNLVRKLNDQEVQESEEEPENQEEDTGMDQEPNYGPEYDAEQEAEDNPDEAETPNEGEENKEELQDETEDSPEETEAPKEGEEMKEHPQDENEDDPFDLNPFTDEKANTNHSKTLFVTSFDKLMRLGTAVNQHFNQAIHLVHQDSNGTDEDEEEGSLKEEVAQFEKTKELLLETAFQPTRLAEEVDNLYKSIDYVQMTPEEALRFFGFYEQYQTIMNSVSTRSKEYSEIKERLVSTVTEYNNKMRDMLKGIDNIRNLDKFLARIATPYRDEYLHPRSNSEKVNMGEKMADVLIDFGETFYNQFANIEEGLEVNDSIRVKLFNIITDLSKLVPDENHGLKKSASGIMRTGLIGLIALILNGFTR